MLFRSFNSGEDPESAGLVLARQGPSALLPIVAAHTNLNSEVRAAVAWHLDDFHPDVNGNLRISVNGDDRVWPNFKPSPSAMTPALLKLLEDKEPVVRFRAAFSLGKIGGDAATIVPALIARLKDDDPIVRGNAAEALGQFREAARPAVPDLERMRADSNQNVRAQAASALKLIGRRQPDTSPPIERVTNKLPRDAGKEFLLTISAEIDGSDRFIFTRENLRHEHLHMRRPQKVIFNGAPWTNLNVPPSGWNALAENLDLEKAQIVKRVSRDTIALEITSHGFDLYFADTLSGGALYEVSISVPSR